MLPFDGSCFISVLQYAAICSAAGYFIKRQLEVPILASGAERVGNKSRSAHTWNTQDALSGKIDYKRGIGNYEKKLFIRPEWQGKRLFLRFEGANSIADVFINRRHIGEHRGGYGAFVFEITGEVNYGKENSILVRVNNGEQLDVMPLVGDFNFYGGIYRDVHLLITDEACISPLNYASPGVRLIQDSVSHQYAKIRAVVDLANGNNAGQEVELGTVCWMVRKWWRNRNRHLLLPGMQLCSRNLHLR